jgi:hypothetical protein
MTLQVAFVVAQGFVGFLHDIAPSAQVSVKLESQASSAGTMRLCPTAVVYAPAQWDWLESLQYDAECGGDLIWLWWREAKCENHPAAQDARFKQESK